MQLKRLVTVALAILVSLAALDAQEKKEQPKKKKNEEVTFAVNMFCENCKAKIEKNISWERGVKNLTVDLEKKNVKIVYDPKKTTEEMLEKAVEKLGYTCEKQKLP
jgi:copper chaperone CopZ